MKKIALVTLLALLLVCVTACGLLDQLTCEHQYQVEETVQPTCTSKGYVKSVCSLCEKVKYEDIDRLPHSLEAQETVQPTCTSKGYTTYKCSVCGYTEQQDFVDTLPHQFTTQVTEPTCTSQGYTTNTCTVCGETVTSNTVDALPHELTSTVTPPTCTTDGYTYNKCNNCDFEETTDTVPATGHSWGDWVTDTPATETSDGQKSRTCKTCDEVQTQIIPSLTYTDNSALRLQWDATQTQPIESFELLSAYFNSAVLNNYTTTSYQLGFDFELEALLAQLIENCNVPFSYDVQSQLQTSSTKILTLTINVVNQTPTASTSGTDYTQLASANTQPYTQKRTSSWDEFAYNQRSLTVTVSSSEQLWYVLEQGGKPVPVTGTPAEKMLGKMKAVLRQICDDSMTDVQKVLAIHDWVVANVSYDHKLLEMMEAQLSLSADERQSLSHYDAFFLEGVFDNNKAVCEGIAKAVACLCNIEGIPCVTVEGVPAGNSAGLGHAWNKVLMDGKWYVVDATSDNLMLSGSNPMEVHSYQFFGLTDSQYALHYDASTRKDIVCNTEMDVHSLLGYTYYGSNADFVAVSSGELLMLIRHLFAMDGPATIEFVIAFDVGASAQDEISVALQQVGASSGSVSFVENDSLYLLIKNN